MNTHPVKKILIALDLDETHFDSSSDKISWIGDKINWINHYTKLQEEAKKNNIELIFMIVTHKSSSDDICEEAAREFKPFLPAAMYTTYKNLECVVVNELGNLSLVSIVPNNIISWEIPDSLRTQYTTHFYVTQKNKSVCIKEIATLHQIPHDQILVFDDNEHVLSDVSNAGMHCVSCAEFPKMRKLLSIPIQINPVVEKVQSRFTDKFTSIINHILQKQFEFDRAEKKKQNELKGCQQTFLTDNASFKSSLLFSLAAFALLKSKNTSGLSLILKACAIGFGAKLFESWFAGACKRKTNARPELETNQYSTLQFSDINLFKLSRLPERIIPRPLATGYLTVRNKLHPFG